QTCALPISPVRWPGRSSSPPWTRRWSSSGSPPRRPRPSRPSSSSPSASSSPTVSVDTSPHVAVPERLRCRKGLLEMSTDKTSAVAEAVDRQESQRQRWGGLAARLTQVNPAVMPTAAAVLLFVLMVGYGELSYGGIIQYNTLSNLLINNAYLIIIAVGMTFVILTGGIDLSVGPVIAFSSVAGVMLAGAGWDPWLVVGLMVGIGALFELAARVLVEHFNDQPFIATLATMIPARGPASTLSTTPGRITAIVVVAAGFFVLHRTRMGRTAYAVGGSEQAATLMGLPVRSTRFLVYVVSGGLAGVAAVVYTSRLGIAQNITGIGWEL